MPQSESEVGDMNMFLSQLTSLLIQLSQCEHLGVENMDYECSLYTVADTNLRKVSIWEKNQGQNI